MRYVSGFLLGTAAAAHTGALVNVLGLGLLVSAGVVAFAFAIEAIVKEALRPPAQTTLYSNPTAAALTDAELRRIFSQPPRKD